MADQFDEGSSTSKSSEECSDTTVELNIKTLDSHIYSFKVDKKMLVSVFKEKIANEVGVPVDQQRLIFRGKVLKDDQPLSEYHMDNGHTLHLVERQQAQSQPLSSTSAGEANTNDASRGNDAGDGAPRNRVGQISHSVVLGTFNVGEQGEGIVPDLSRVIGAVLNSLGMGNQTTTNGASGIQSTMAGQRNEEDGNHGNGSGQAQNQAQSGQAIPNQPFQSFPQVVQIPVAAAAVPIPSLHVPIPDSLNTLSVFMNRMEQALSENGYWPNPSSNSVGGDPPRVELPSNAQGLPTPEALSIVLRHVQRILSDHAVSALSHIAGRLEQEQSSVDATVRGQIQTESMQVGIAMQQMGALLLEIGRTMLTLRMGQSPAESVVNAGPAVYISPSGPSPIMVQPFPLQASSLLGGTAPSSNPLNIGPVGVGNAPRHINVHIHAVGTRANNGEGLPGSRRNGTGSAESGATRVLPARNVTAAAGSSLPVGMTMSTLAQPGQGVSVPHPPPESVSLSSVTDEIHSRSSGSAGNLQGHNVVQSGQGEVTVQGTTDYSGISRMPEDDGIKASIPDSQCSSDSMDASTCLNDRITDKSGDCMGNTPGPSKKHNMAEGAVPLGLGFGGLERKRPGRQQTLLNKGSNGGASSGSGDQGQQNKPRTTSQQILQSLASRSTVNRLNAHGPSANQPPSTVSQVRDHRLSEGSASDGQIDLASSMSQVLQSPVLNGLLSGVSEQIGVGSPDVLRNMLQQFTQSPQMQNTVNEIAKQVDGQVIENIFTGMGNGQGSGMDLSSIFQQMMPVVSRALSRGSMPPEPSPSGTEPQPNYSARSSGVHRLDEHNFQTDLQQVAQRIEHMDSPEDIFRAVAESSVQLSDSNGGMENIMDAICNDDTLANEYFDILRRDVSERPKQGPAEDQS